VRILLVEITTLRKKFVGGDFPCLLIFVSGAPPRQARFEFIKFDGLRLGVIFPSIRQGLFVVPNLPGWSGAIEEQNVGGNSGVRREHTVGQAHDGVQVKFLDQFFLDARAYAVAK
jgi:hypothetical protein